MARIAYVAVVAGFAVYTWPLISALVAVVQAALALGSSVGVG